MNKLLFIVLSLGVSCLSNTLNAENQSPVQNEQSLLKQPEIQLNPWLKLALKCQEHVDNIEDDEKKIRTEIEIWKLSHNTPLTRRQKAELQNKVERANYFAKLKNLRIEQIKQFEMKYQQSLE